MRLAFRSALLVGIETAAFGSGLSAPAPGRVFRPSGATVSRGMARAHTDAAPCAMAATTLCLNGSRFQVQVAWQALHLGTSGAGQAVPLTSDTGYFWFFSSGNVELVIKVVDGTPVNGMYWVFYGALSNVQYTITVTDTKTGRVKIYFNPQDTLASVADTSAFAASSTPMQKSKIAVPPFSAGELLKSAASPKSETAASGVASGCTPDARTLCLNSGRFKVQVAWQALHLGTSGVGQAVPLTSDTGYFWFFSSGNVELVVKVVDGTPVNGDYWVFYGALSNVQYMITVTDTVTGRVETYFNPQDTFGSVADTSAFPPSLNANGRLNGQYAFLFQGFDASGPVAIAGSFTADGNGTLTSGLEDVNRGSGVTLSLAFTGTYSINADDRGTFTLTGSPGGPTLGSFRFALGSISAGVASRARFIEFDSSGTRGTGVIARQDPAAFSTTEISGDYVFGASAPTSGTGRFGVAGRFTAAAGSISDGVVDKNNTGTLNSNAAFTGRYTVAANGRGTLTLDIVGAGAPANGAFYVVSRDELLIISSATRTVSSLFAGTILRQSGSGTFSNSSLNDTYVITVNGLNDDGTAHLALGLLTPSSSGNLTLSGDERDGGAPHALDQSGTFSVASNGRVTVTGLAEPMVLYLASANKGFVLGTNGTVPTGFLESQAGGPFSTATATGVFFLGTTAAMRASVSDLSGVGILDGSGSIAATTDLSQPGALLSDQAYTDTYAIAPSGRGTTAAGLVVYVISPSKVVLMDASSIQLAEK